MNSLESGVRSEESVSETLGDFIQKKLTGYTGDSKIRELVNQEYQPERVNLEHIAKLLNLSLGRVYFLVKEFERDSRPQTPDCVIERCQGSRTIELIDFEEAPEQLHPIKEIHEKLLQARKDRRAAYVSRPDYKPPTRTELCVLTRGHGCPNCASKFPIPKQLADGTCGPYPPAHMADLGPHDHVFPGAPGLPQIVPSVVYRTEKDFDEAIRAHHSENSIRRQQARAAVHLSEYLTLPFEQYRKEYSIAFDYGRQYQMGREDWPLFDCPQDQLAAYQRFMEGEKGVAEARANAATLPLPAELALGWKEYCARHRVFYWGLPEQALLEAQTEAARVPHPALEAAADWIAGLVATDAPGPDHVCKPTGCGGYTEDEWEDIVTNATPAGQEAMSLAMSDTLSPELGSGLSEAGQRDVDNWQARANEEARMASAIFTRIEIMGGGVPVLEVRERPRSMCSDLINGNWPGCIYRRYIFLAADDLPDHLDMAVQLPTAKQPEAVGRTPFTTRIAPYPDPIALTTIGELLHHVATVYTPPWEWDESEHFTGIEIEDNRRVNVIVESVRGKLS